jgi:dienelactone hydrolase
VTGNYAQFAANATEEFRKQLPENAIQAVRNQLRDLAGDFEYVKSIDLKDFVSHYYELKAHHAKMSMVYTVVFDKEGKLQGFLVKPDNDADDSAPKGPESTDTWAESEVTFNADAQYPISGYLTLPKNVEKPPIVIFVHGSGCNDRNETVSANAPFRDIAHGLAERGIATLRYDKRCKLYPDSAAPDKVTIQTEATDDFDAAVRMLQGDARVDAKRIFVVGHSLGGMLVPYLADRHPELAGAISMSGTLRPFFDVMKQQQTLAIAEMQKSPDAEASVSQLNALVRELDEKVPKLDALPDDELIIGQPVRYWKSLRDATGEKLLANTKVPILVLWGSADMQIYAEDFDLWLAAEKKYPNLRCMRFDRLNHLMIPTTLENPNLMEISKDYAVASKVDAAVIEAIAGFVKSGK